MNHQENLTKIGVFSLCFWLFGFFIDGDERVPDIGVNIFEIVIMTSITFVILSICYFAIQGVRFAFKSKEQRV